jgi:hypothetical protein
VRSGEGAASGWGEHLDAASRLAWPGRVVFAKRVRSYTRLGQRKVILPPHESVVGIVRLDDGAHVTVNMPITEHELNLYKESPGTFFGIYEPTTRVTHAVELYELFLSVYSQTTRERLLEFLAAHPNIEFRELPQLELAKIYSEGLANKSRLTAIRPGLLGEGLPISESVCAKRLKDFSASFRAAT